MGKLLEGSVTKLVVKSGERDAYLWDSSLPGFGVRAYASGKRSFICKYQMPDGKQRKVSLGPALPGMLAETRKKAHDILAKARLGQDVVGEKRSARERAAEDLTVGDLVKRYLQLREADRNAGEISPRSYVGIEYHLNMLLAPLHGRPPESIRQRDISNLVDGLAAQRGKRTADSCRTSISTFFAWLIEKEYAGANPCSGVKRRNKAGPRERYLTPEELKCIWRATEPETDYNLIVRLLALTAARRDEIGGLRWSEVDIDAGKIRLPKERVKNGRKTRKGHVIFLSPPAMAILRNIMRRPKRNFVFGMGKGPFSGWSRAKASLDEKLPKHIRATRLNAKGEVEKNPNGWTVHDLRRTFGTYVVERGLASVEVKEAALGHRQQNIERTYNVSPYDAQRSELMRKWADALLTIVDETAEPLVSLVTAEQPKACEARPTG
jgi:integrase